MIQTVVIIHWYFASDEITRRPTEKITHSENISGNDRSKYLKYTDLIGFNPRRLKGLNGDELPRNGPSRLREIFF